MTDRCSVCGKSFRGHDPLTDGKGNYFHKKCAPKLDVHAMRKNLEVFFKLHGIDGVTTERREE